VTTLLQVGDTFTLIAPALVTVNNISQPTAVKPGFIPLTDSYYSCVNSTTSFVQSPFITCTINSAPPSVARSHPLIQFYFCNANNTGEFGCNTGAGTGYWFNAYAAAQITPVLSFTSSPPSSTTVGATYTVSASSTELTYGGIAYSVDTSSNAVCSISGTTVTSLRAGSCTININQSSNSGAALAAAQVQQSFTVTAPPPVLSAVSPSYGAAAGGTTVTVTGANLTGATSVSFGGVVATNLTVVSATSITATTPAHAAGPVSVAVTTAGGTSTLSGAYLNVNLSVASNVSQKVPYNSSSNSVNLSYSNSPTSVAVDSGPSHGSVAVSGLTMSYTPTTGYFGEDSFTYTVSNYGLTSVPATAGLTVSPPTLVAAPATGTLSTVVAGNTYSQAFTTSGGASGYSYGVKAGALPLGLAFVGNTLSGTPTTAGVYNFTISVQDSSTTTPATLTTAYSLAVTALPVPVLVFSTPTSASVNMGSTLSNPATSTLSAGNYGATSYSSSNTAVATVNSSGVVTPVGGGTATITATQAGITGVNASAAQSYTLNVSILAQATLSASATPNAIVVVTGTAALGTSGGSGTGTVGYAVNSGGCTISGTTLTAGATLGNCVVTATKVADVNYGASSATTTVTVLALPVPVLTFATQMAVSLNMGSSFTNTAISSLSGGSYGAITYTSADTTVATVTALGVITPVGAGTTTITATQAAVTNSNAGATRSYALSVNLMTQSALSVSATPNSIASGSGTSTLSVAGGSGKGAVAYSVTSGACTVSGTTLTAGATAGTCVVSAIKAPDTSFSASTGTVSVSVYLSRADISTAASEASVVATLAAQVSAAQRFTSTQIQNNTNHLDGLKGCGLSIGCNRVAIGMHAQNFEQIKPFIWKLQEAITNSPDGDQAPSTSMAKSVSNSYLNTNYFMRVSQSDGPQNQVALASNSPALEETKFYDNGDALQSPVAYWASGSLDYGSTLGGVLSNAANRFNSSGFTLGLDYQLAGNAVLGASLGYGFDKTDIGSDGTQVNSSLYSLAVYAVLQPREKWYADALLGYGKLNFDGKRFSSTERAVFASSRSGRSIFGQFGFSSLQERAGFSLNPFVLVNVVNIDLENYSETGPINALSYRAATLDGKTIAAGLGISYGIPMDNGKLTPALKLQFANNQGLTIEQNICYADSAPSAASSYDLYEEVMPQRTGSVSFGVNYALRNEISLGVGWLGTYGADAYRSNALKLDIRIGF
jgi:hypothetical protein